MYLAVFVASLEFDHFFDYLWISGGYCYNMLTNNIINVNQWANTAYIHHKSSSTASYIISLVQGRLWLAK